MRITQIGVKGARDMILSADIGNTSIRLGIFDGSRLTHRIKLTADKKKSSDEYAVLLSGIFAMREIDSARLEGAIIASVVPPLTYTICRALEAFSLKPLVVGSGIRTGLNIRIDQPAMLGADIVAAAVAAQRLAKPPMVVIDLGTATTLTAINRKGELCGCLIVPGVRLGLDALSEKCSLLPDISLTVPTKLLGTNSADSLNSGAVYGAALMLDGFIDKIREQLLTDGEETLSVIATGGASELIIPLCQSEIRREPDLTLRGLAYLYTLNSKT